MELKKTVEVINHVWDDDLDAFLFHHFGRHYEFEKFHDLPEDKLFPIETYVDTEFSKFDAWQVEQFIKGEEMDMPCLHALLCHLCQEDLVEKGYYLISRNRFKNET